MKVATRNFVNPLDPHFQELVTSIRKELPACFFFLGNDTIFRLFYKGSAPIQVPVRKSVLPGYTATKPQRFYQGLLLRHF